MAAFDIHAPDWQKFGSELRSTSPALRFKTRATVRHWAEVFTAESVAAAAFSSHIPGSFRIVGMGDNVVVYAGGESAPSAAPIENEGKRGTFRHPVFGNRDVWVSQRARPFFGPAFNRVTAALPEREMGVFFNETFHHIGYV